MAVKPVRRADIVARDIGGEIILYSANQEEIHILNPTAQVIWELCDGKHSVEDIEQTLYSKFSIPTGHNVSADIKQTLDVFTAKGLLQESA